MDDPTTMNTATGPAPLRVVAHGGGIQTTAMQVLAARGDINFRTFLFCNVGDDSENPGTLAYMEHVARPYAKRMGLDLHVLDRVRRDGTVETLYGRLTRTGSRSLPIPVRMSNGAPGTRSCTADFKIKLIGRWVKTHGATGGRAARNGKPAIPARLATVAVGISLDEATRMNARKAEPYERLAYPLVGYPADEDTGLRMTRQDCERLILSEPLDPGHAEYLIGVAGELPAVTRRDLERYQFTRMPRPPKSACWFCPFHRPSTWHDMRRDDPELFAKSCDLEDLLNDRRDQLGKDHVYLTRYGHPLRVAIPDGVDLLPLADGDDDFFCDNGRCMT